MRGGKLPFARKVVHVCARCGKEMAYLDKRMLYMYRTEPYRKGGYRVRATVKINLCTECDQAVAEAIGREVRNFEACRV